VTRVNGSPVTGRLSPSGLPGLLAYGYRPGTADAGGCKTAGVDHPVGSEVVSAGVLRESADNTQIPDNEALRRGISLVPFSFLRGERRNPKDLGEVASEFFHDAVGVLRIGDAGQDAGKALLVLRLHPPGDLDPLGLR
jgi:hypothetical protein